MDTPSPLTPELGGDTGTPPPSEMRSSQRARETPLQAQERFFGMLREIRDAQAEILTRLEALEEQQQTFRAEVCDRLEEVESGLESVKGDVEDIASSISGLENAAESIDGLESALQVLETTIDGIESTVNSIDSTVNNIESNMDSY